jgi:hypothetical protein
MFLDSERGKVQLLQLRSKVKVAFATRSEEAICLEEEAEA